MPEPIKPTWFLPVGEPLTGSLLLSGQENYSGQRHQLAITEYGNPNGIPVIFVHGGPGAGTSPEDTEFFNLENYHVILFDQRGSGASTPANCLEGNNTPNLIEDIESIRKSMGLDKVILFGGSWGSTLSLLYAIKYPEHVLGLALRGIFLGEKNGIEAFFREDSAAVKNHPDEWREFINIAFPDEAARQNYDNAPLDSKFEILSQALYAGITQGNWKAICAAYSTWEVINAVPPGSEDRAEAMAWCQSNSGITMGLMEVFYIINKLWLDEGFILSNIDKLIKPIIQIVQGDNDDVCPPKDQAFKLFDELSKINPFAKLFITDGGHFAHSKSNKEALINVMSDFSITLAHLINQSASSSLDMGAGSSGDYRLSNRLPRDSIFQATHYNASSSEDVFNIKKNSGI